MKRLEHLVIVAGAPASGKSTLIDGLVAGRFPELAAELGAGDPCTWQCLSAAACDGARCGPHTCLHYDLSRPWTMRFASQGYAGDPALLIWPLFERVSVLTVWAPPDVIESRSRSRRVQPAGAPGRPGGLRHRWQRAILRRSLGLQPVARFYRDPEQVTAWYAAWTRYAENRPATRCLLVDTSGDAPRVVADGRSLGADAAH